MGHVRPGPKTQHGPAVGPEHGRGPNFPCEPTSALASESGARRRHGRAHAVARRVEGVLHTGAKLAAKPLTLPCPCFPSLSRCLSPFSSPRFSARACVGDPRGTILQRKHAHRKTCTAQLFSA